MTADIKPVAWVSNRDPMFGDGWGATSPIVYSDPGAHAAPSGELVPLYPQSAIDSLQVMLDDAHADFKEMERLAHMHKARAERAEAEVEALRNLAGCAYQFAGIHDAPEAWLDALSNAASGEPFTCDGLLPYIPDAAREGRE